MLKESQMCIKLETKLHKAFVAASKRVHRPAAQIIRALMRTYVSHVNQKPEPNHETLTALSAIEQGEFNTYKGVNDFYEKMQI